MTTKARCSIYGDRPKGCREYPKIDSYRPEECTYYFIDGKRMGSCDCGVGACCALPRDGGTPDGKHLPAAAGGKPCKYLEQTKEKTASALPIRPTSRSAAIKAALDSDER